jgi:hypothetical protein
MKIVRRILIGSILSLIYMEVICIFVKCFIVLIFCIRIECESQEEIKKIVETFFDG